MNWVLRLLFCLLFCFCTTSVLLADDPPDGCGCQEGYINTCGEDCEDDPETCCELNVIPITGGKTSLLILGGIALVLGTSLKITPKSFGKSLGSFWQKLSTKN
jgi:hypothetical protein